MTLEAVFLLIFGFAGANLLGAKLISPYFAHGGGVLFFHLWAFVSFLVFLGAGGLGARRKAQRRFWIAVVSVSVMVLGATIRQTHLRQPSGMQLGVHDGAVHTEVAAAIFLDGQNPYAVDYRDTAYGLMNPPIPGGPVINVVWSHYIYPPLAFFVFVPGTFIANVLGVMPDIRWLLLAALAFGSWLVIRTTADWDRRTRYLLLTAGNPFIWLYVVAGYNDILAAAALLATAAAWQSKRWAVAGIAFGLAVGLKQSAWLALPLFALVLQQWARPHRLAAWRSFGIIVAATYLPFLLWNGPALYDDIIRYASGAIPYSYPISGATFLQYLPIFGLVPSPWSVLATFWWQLAVGLPVFVGLALWLRRQPSPGTWLTSVIFLTLSILLFSRYLNNNYISGLIFLAVAAYAFRPVTNEE